MQELLLIFAEIMPLEEIANFVGEAAEEYRLNPNKESLGKLQASCALLLAKEAVAKNGLDETMRAMSETGRIRGAMNNKS